MSAQISGALLSIFCLRCAVFWTPCFVFWFSSPKPMTGRRKFLQWSSTSKLLLELAIKVQSGMRI